MADSDISGHLEDICVSLEDLVKAMSKPQMAPRVVVNPTMNMPDRKSSFEITVMDRDSAGLIKSLRMTAV